MIGFLNFSFSLKSIEWKTKQKNVFENIMLWMMMAFLIFIKRLQIPILHLHVDLDLSDTFSNLLTT